jgi:hypothetical protein
LVPDPAGPKTLSPTIERFDDQPMGTSLNLLIVESHAGAADRAAAELEAEGHTVHRCHEDARHAFPCAGVSGAHGCPVDQPLDVALLVRRGVGPSPTPLEDGVPCALRAGIPVVEDGTDLLDPYDEFLTTRVRNDESVADACRRAVVEAMEPLEAEVAAALVPFLEANGMSAQDCSVRLEPRGDLLRIHLQAEGLTPMLTGQLSVKAVDTVRAMRRSWPSIEVTTADLAPN